MLWPFGLFYITLVYVMTFWYILRAFGLFSPFWNEVPWKIWQPWHVPSHGRNWNSSPDSRTAFLRRPVQNIQSVNIPPRGQSSPLGGPSSPQGAISPLEANHVVTNWPQGSGLITLKNWTKNLSFSFFFIWPWNETVASTLYFFFFAISYYYRIWSPFRRDFQRILGIPVVKRIIYVGYITGRKNLNISSKLLLSAQNVKLKPETFNTLIHRHILVS
jgi:hypothetical protein